MSQIERKFDLLNIVISKYSFYESNHESDNSIESKNQLKCLKDVKRLLIQVIFWFYAEDFLFKHKIKSSKGCLVDALAIRGDEGRERLR